MPKRKRQTRDELQQHSAEDTQPFPTRRRSKAVIFSSEEATVNQEAHNVQQCKVESNGKAIICERRGKDSKPKLIFTHGAGGGLSNPATKDFADGFAEHSSVVSFQGTMNLQSRIRAFQTVIEHEEANDCALGGRSMGARAAVITAQQSSADHEALILVSYPMIGAQKGDSREQILLDLPASTDVLFISGSRDSMCSMEHLRRICKAMKARGWIVEVEGADHGMAFKPKGAAEEMRSLTGRIAARWLDDRDKARRYCEVGWDEEGGGVVASDWGPDQAVHDEVENSTDTKPARKRKRK